MFQLIKLLLDSGAEVDIRDNQDRTPLHFAVVANRISVIQLLIKSGMQVQIKMVFGSDTTIKNGKRPDL